MALLIDVWIVKLFMIDFNEIMETNSMAGEIVTTLSKEIEIFDDYVRDSDSVDKEIWQETARQTSKAIYAVPLSYGKLGDERYAKLQSLRSAYEVYCNARDKVIEDSSSSGLHVEEVYDVYGMQNYLSAYAQGFVDSIIQEGNARYKALLPKVVKVPVIATVLSIILFLFILRISRILNRSVTAPVVKLATASRRIANNDFFIDDVVVDNKDELGDMVSAFNKMKFATSEYIKALEEKREVLDKLHAQEMETLEIEKQIEAMNLELLKSQINPHFLFNTLNVIAGNANLEGAETTEQLIEALSSLFRYNLKTHAKETYLYQELKISRDYMYLQKMRFGSRVEFEIDCEVDENKTIVPTFVFQPLLENAIIHGLAPKVEGGKVTIRIRRDEDRLLIDVEDTGVGIDKDILTNIKKHLQNGRDAFDNTEIVGIGLGNINRRIRAMYKEGSLDINGNQYGGTTVSICIPANGVEN
ncbi:sensor histidine kinase [Butyrivibrio proteoclasticus]|uniref:sensor histidine kinase n=1 Tax=Butyrivibrio proteoclasticus TaxID=43305 RepID=UPI000685C41D|nr:sensor histidine kinase [Butyrivibrio proteoclasticus]